MSLQKARISFLKPMLSGGSKPKLSAGGGIAVNGRTQLEFDFNPKEYSIQKSADWQRSSATGAQKTSVPEFKGSGPRQLSLEVFLDRSLTRGDVSTDVETLFACLTPLPETLAANKPVPPFVKFCWGTTIEFTAVLKSVNAKYTLFTSEGAPLRAVCTISLEEFPEQAGRQNPTSGGLAPLRMHTVVAGDTLQSVAYTEYGSPTLWRAIAEENQIDDPLRLRPGTQLRVPPPDQALQSA
ncbi:MAG: LysM peptidoglycan-binding domain-containing protein [Egibacteraceae bacterium]